jgi:hypothetical protein
VPFADRVGFGKARLHFFAGEAAKIFVIVGAGDRLLGIGHRKMAVQGVGDVGCNCVDGEFSSIPAILKAESTRSCRPNRYSATSGAAFGSAPTDPAVGT